MAPKSKLLCTNYCLCLLALIFTVGFTLFALTHIVHANDETSILNHLLSSYNLPSRLISSESVDPLAIPSLLFMTASYSFDQFIALQKSIDSIRDICNSGWDVTVLIQTSPMGIHEQHPLYSSFRESLFCVRTGNYIPLVLEQFEAVGFGLNSKHRAFAAARIEEFDWFCYAEEDMLLTPSHLQAHVRATQQLQQAFPSTSTPSTPSSSSSALSSVSSSTAASWLRYQIGFLRYEDSVVGSTDRVTWEYMPQHVSIYFYLNN